jgi:predicted double-glycine peptidase
MTMWRYHGYALILILFTIGSVLAGEQSGNSIRRHTLKELRDQYVVKQQLDYSCGAAALATLLTYYFGDEASERELLELLTAQLTRDELKLKERQGFSLLDLKHVAQAKGYRAAGFKLTIEQLKQLAAPVLVFVEPRGYKHFAILRGVDRGRVFLADPARGNLRMSISTFLREWHGIVFVLGRSGEEELTTYPLALSRPNYVQPELLRVSRMSDFGAFVTGLVVRSR